MPLLSIAPFGNHTSLMKFGKPVLKEAIILYPKNELHQYICLHIKVKEPMMCPEVRFSLGIVITR